MDLTEAEYIKKRWQEYTQGLYKKTNKQKKPKKTKKKKKKKTNLHDPNNHDGVITHLEPDILEYEVKWVLGTITMNKASGGDGIPVELFQNLKGYSLKVLHSICQQI